MSYSVIDNVLTNLLPVRFAGLLSGARRLECDDDGKQAVRVRPRSSSTGFKSGLFDGQFSVSTNSGTWRLKNATVCREWWADVPSCWKLKLLPDNFWVFDSKPWFRNDDVTVIRTVDFGSRLNKHQWRFPKFETATNTMMLCEKCLRPCFRLIDIFILLLKYANAKTVLANHRKQWRRNFPMTHVRTHYALVHSGEYWVKQT